MNSLPENISAVINSIDEEHASEIKRHLIDLINELITKDFFALVQLLYKIDVNEEKLKQTLMQHKETDAAILIAELIIKRQLQKANYKKQFGDKEKLNEDDAW